ncbi:MAG: hypothetical protein E7307_09265 [Butyrivibrio sp.]|nr:hypothetical protein [Butyrivibrio sp.]
MTNQNNPEEKYAHLIKAFLNMMVTGQVSVNFLNAGKLKREMASSIEAFKGEDLEGFANFFVDSSLHSSAYRTTFFGTVPMSDGGAATKLAEDIDEITGKIAGRFGLADEARPLRTALFKAYIDQVKDGHRILEELNITL